MKQRSDEERRLLLAAIEACRDDNGILWPETVLEAARNPDSPLHAEYDWDDESAARTARLARTRELINEAREFISYGGRTLAHPVFVPNPRRVEGGYVRTLAVATNADLKRMALTRELENIRNSIRRALALAVAFEIASDFEKLLDEVVRIELRVTPT